MRTRALEAEELRAVIETLYATFAGYPLRAVIQPIFRSLMSGHHKAVPPLTGGATPDRLSVGREAHA